MDIYIYMYIYIHTHIISTIYTPICLQRPYLFRAIDWDGTGEEGAEAGGGHTTTAHPRRKWWGFYYGDVWSSLCTIISWLMYQGRFDYGIYAGFCADAMSVYVRFYTLRLDKAQQHVFLPENCFHKWEGWSTGKKKKQLPLPLRMMLWAPSLPELSKGDPDEPQKHNNLFWGLWFLMLKRIQTV